MSSIYLSNWVLFKGKRTYDKNRKETTVMMMANGVVVGGETEEEVINNPIEFKKALMRSGIKRPDIQDYTAVSVTFIKKMQGLND
jgi:hypothetical protein